MSHHHQEAILVQNDEQDCFRILKKKIVSSFYVKNITEKLLCKWILNIRGYYGREKIVVNLGC